MRRTRNAKIVATLGPSSSDRAMIQSLFEAGADVFRLNFSHGTHEDHRARFDIIRDLERESGRPIGVLLDLQGPKLRIGSFAGGPVQLRAGDPFRFDLQADVPGDTSRIALPHPEIFAALEPGTDLLLDDGRIRMKVDRCVADFAETTVVVGGALSDRKGVNVPGVVVPLSAMTPKDRRDLAFGLTLGVDWIALSFVQRVEDIVELRGLVGDNVGIVAKLEKPAAIQALDAIVQAADAVMVARGDLGVEMPPEQVPGIQKRIIRCCRQHGRPVIIATQMLESMVAAPVPTRAEASDVANAIYDGADAVMLSAESASGKYPRQAVSVMNSVIEQTEEDPTHRQMLDASLTPAPADFAGGIATAMRQVAALLEPVAIVAYTNSGFTAYRMSRERPTAPILGLTPNHGTARRLSLVWGVHSALTQVVASVGEMTSFGCQATVDEGFGVRGDTVVIIAGLPLAQSGTTNLMRIAHIV
ncbi:MAG: pyk [Panacagrimonas sp.]|jgi:pyruvate kinase|nr:pyruvate kinase [Panacagrimonas sp.]MCC2655159.1 pyk [Panacagrimonas sp.]